MHWELHDLAERPKLLVMVSKFDHCLNDLLYRWRSATLPVDIAAIVSNHPDLVELARWTASRSTTSPSRRTPSRQAEARLLGLVDEHDVDLVVLARYMQVLSDDLCKALAGRAINIHHSFLPSFKGAKPYHQAHARGVKLIGATAHYVTADLDEGPIIEQDVVRVGPPHTARRPGGAGPRRRGPALARAVQWHCRAPGAAQRPPHRRLHVATRFQLGWPRAVQVVRCRAFPGHRRAPSGSPRQRSRRSRR